MTVPTNLRPPFPIPMRGNEVHDGGGGLLAGHRVSDPHEG